MRKSPSFSDKEMQLSSVSLKTSPTVKALYLAKSAHLTLQEGPIDWAFTRDSGTGDQRFIFAIRRKEFILNPFDIDDGVNPEACNSLVQPPVDHENLAQDRILPIEVWPILVERMKIVFVGARNRLPNTAPVLTFPVKVLCHFR